MYRFIIVVLYHNKASPIVRPACFPQTFLLSLSEIEKEEERGVGESVVSNADVASASARVGVGMCK